MDQFLLTETIVIGLLLIITLVAVMVRSFRVPYTVALVIVGLAIAYLRPLEFTLTPQLILALFVPPLVFEAAFHLNLTALRRTLPIILMLAVPGVIVTMWIVAVILAWGVAITLPIALLFGAMIAATDPVAVVALFRTLGVPRQLGILVEGESLFNDGTAIVLFNLVLASALTGHFDLGGGIIDFIRIAAGGTVIGLSLGWLVSRIIARVDDYLIETTLTTILAFGSYLIAERVQFSGVLAVVAAGLIIGNMGPQGMSPTTRIVLFNFWEYVAFLANSLIFLLIGLQVDIPALLDAWRSVLWAISAVLVARAIVVYGLGWLGSRFAEPIPFRWLHITNWGGLRGAICLALVLSLPTTIDHRDLLRLMTFGVVLFTLLVQGMTMGPLLHRLRIVIRSESQVEYETRHARMAALRAAQAHLDNLYRQGLISGHVMDHLKAELAGRTEAAARAVDDLLHSEPALETQELETSRRELLHAERSALQALFRDGVISEEVLEKLITLVDVNLDQAATPSKQTISKQE